MLFTDRRDAGKRLAKALSRFKNEDCVVLALPRGGVPVAAEVAAALHAPLDVILVRKIGAPRRPELAVGSVVDGGTPIIVCDRELMNVTGTLPAQFDAICARELAEIERRRHLYLGHCQPAALKDRVVILVDDGLATGNTMRAALQAVRMHSPKMTVVAVPVAPPGIDRVLRDETDLVVCLATPEPFGAVGQFYDDFDPVSDSEVISLLAANRQTA
jgi:predicted phosphoribosyltransferase